FSTTPTRTSGPSAFTTREFSGIGLSVFFLATAGRTRHACLDYGRSVSAFGTMRIAKIQAIAAREPASAALARVLLLFPAVSFGLAIQTIRFRGCWVRESPRIASGAFYFSVPSTSFHG